MITIGYLGDELWAHEAFKRLINDDAIVIKFVSVRYDKQDSILISLAKERNIPLEIHKDINPDEFMEKMEAYDVDLFVSMSFNQICKSATNSLICNLSKTELKRNTKEMTQGGDSLCV